MDARFWAFVAVVTLLIVTPGPDMALVTRNALRGGRRVAALTAGGVSAGSAIWGLTSVLGLAVLLEGSATAFTVVKLVGAAYLLVLGALTLAGRSWHLPSAVHRRPRAALGDRTAFAQGLVGNLLNPKAGAIFVTVVPQFIRPGDSPLRLLAMLGAYEAVLSGWLTLYGYVVVRTARGRAGARVRALLSRVTGLILIGLGVRLAVERG